MEYCLEHFGPCSFGIRRLETHQQLLTVRKQNEHLHSIGIYVNIWTCLDMTVVSKFDVSL